MVNLQVDLVMLAARWYVTHSGLLRVAHRRRCSSITTELVEGVSNPKEGRRIFKASVVKSGTVHFVGYGDANPSNLLRWFTAPRCGSAVHLFASDGWARLNPESR